MGSKKTADNRLQMGIIMKIRNFKPAGRRVLAGVLGIIMVLSMGFPVQKVYAEERRTVRVGIFNLGNFQGFDENGDAVGYNIEYLNKIAEINHWSYEYVPAQNWVEATDMLAKGEIDLLAPAQKTDALVEQFDYVVYTMGTEFAAIYTLATVRICYMKILIRWGNYVLELPKIRPFIKNL